MSSRIKKFLTIFLLLFFAPSTPAEEFAAFSISPAFRDIEFAVPVPSEFIRYLDKQDIRPIEGLEVKYDSLTPSFFYGSRATAATASIFVGDQAQRNYIVRKFMQEDYTNVISAFRAYENSWKTPQHREETALLYAISMYRSGLPQGERLLRDSCADGDIFKHIACDKYMELLWNRQSYTEITQIKISKPLSLYTFSVYLLALMQIGDYQKAAELLDDNPSLIFRYSDFNDFRAVTEYNNGNYAAVAALIPYTTNAITFITADSLINLGKHAEAQAYFSELDAEEARFLNAKRNIVRGRLKNTAEIMQSIPDEDKILELLNFYAALRFPKLNRAFLGEFKLTEEDKKYYPIFYEALQLFVTKRYQGAAELFSKISSPSDLAAQAQFYRGISLVYIDPVRAEQDIAHTMNHSEDPFQVTAARFMLAQVFYGKRQDGEAMQLLDGCEESFCKLLMGEINLRRGDFESALENAAGIDTPQAHIIRATAYYNLQDYNGVRETLDQITIFSEDKNHLEMMLLFREGNIEGAKAILYENQTHPPLFYDGIKNLMLAGEHKLVAELLKNRKNLPAEVEVIRAQLLVSERKADQAKAIYERLIKDGKMLYDSFFGLLTLSKGARNEKRQFGDIVNRVVLSDDFPQRDRLLSYLASQASRTGDNAALVRIINAFFPNYADSQYAGVMYGERAKLFQTTGRLQECLQDITDATSRDPALAEGLEAVRVKCN